MKDKTKKMVATGVVLIVAVLLGTVFLTQVKFSTIASDDVLIEMSPEANHLFTSGFPVIDYTVSLYAPQRTITLVVFDFKGENGFTYTDRWHLIDVDYFVPRCPPFSNLDELLDGKYTATVTVTDDLGATASISRIYYVGDEPQLSVESVHLFATSLQEASETIADTKAFTNETIELQAVLALDKKCFTELPNKGTVEVIEAGNVVVTFETDFTDWIDVEIYPPSITVSDSEIILTTVLSYEVVFSYSYYGNVVTRSLNFDIEWHILPESESIVKPRVSAGFELLSVLLLLITVPVIRRAKRRIQRATE